MPVPDNGFAPKSFPENMCFGKERHREVIDKGLSGQRSRTVVACEEAERVGVQDPALSREALSGVAFSVRL